MYNAYRQQTKMHTGGLIMAHCPAAGTPLDMPFFEVIFTVWHSQSPAGCRWSLCRTSPVPPRTGWPRRRSTPPFRPCRGQVLPEAPALRWPGSCRSQWRGACPWRETETPGRNRLHGLATVQVTPSRFWLLVCATVQPGALCSMFNIWSQDLGQNRIAPNSKRLLATRRNSLQQRHVFFIIATHPTHVCCLCLYLTKVISLEAAAALIWRLGCRTELLQSKALANVPTDLWGTCKRNRD